MFLSALQKLTITPDQMPEYFNNNQKLICLLTHHRHAFMDKDFHQLQSFIIKGGVLSCINTIFCKHINLQQYAYWFLIKGQFHFFVFYLPMLPSPVAKGS